MESENKVISEVHYFSKESHCYDGSTKIPGGKEDSLSTSKFMDQKNIEPNKDCENQPGTKDTGEQYTCLLGASGQIVLWNPEFETVLSRFDFSCPRFTDGNSQNILRASIDKDGDFEVVRKSNVHLKEMTLLIEQRCFPKEHHSSTTLELVGEQVWRGAFFLADYILDNPKIFKDANVLEMASGVGLTSIVAALFAKGVIITDVDRGDILDLIHKNVKRNNEFCLAKTYIREIDFFDLRTITDLGSLLDDVTVLLAADVIYHNQLTDAFLNAVLFLMKRKPNKTMFISLEKRYVFTIEDMDTVAPCYEHFVNRLKWLQSQETDTIEWKIEQISTTDLHQYFTYERTNELVLWKIEALSK